MNNGTFDINLAREITGGITAGRIVTRDTRLARIVCWNAKGKRPIVALLDNGKEERVARYTVNGCHDERDNVRTGMDLITETPRKWRVTYKMALQPTTTQELTCYLDLEGVREHFGLLNPGVEHYSIEEITWNKK